MVTPAGLYTCADSSACVEWPRPRIAFSRETGEGCPDWRRPFHLWGDPLENPDLESENFKALEGDSTRSFKECRDIAKKKLCVIVVQDTTLWRLIG